MPVDFLKELWRKFQPAVDIFYLKHHSRITNYRTCNLYPLLVYHINLFQPLVINWTLAVDNETLDMDCNPRKTNGYQPQHRRITKTSVMTSVLEYNTGIVQIEQPHSVPKIIRREGAVIEWFCRSSFSFGVRRIGTNRQ